MAASKHFRKQTQKQTKRAPVPVTPFTVEDVLAAMDDMYVDELKPVNKLLRRRVFARINSSRTIDVDMQVLWDMCRSCPLITVGFEPNGDWYALLVDRPPMFVDISDDSDHYSATMWANFKTFCESPQSHTIHLSGGRCAAAESLRILPDLAGFSLGRLCHIVELALNERKLLGYNDGAIVPYRFSERARKEQSILLQKPSADSRMQVATLEVARTCLQLLLQESPSGTLPLPNVKRLFGAKFKVQLSETVFGHTKVLHLLQDPRFQDICTVEFESGFIVTRKGTRLAGLSKDVPAFDVEVDKPRAVEFCPGEPLPTEEVEMLIGHDDPIWLAPSPALETLQLPLTPAPRWCLSPNTLSKDGYAGLVQNTFIHAKLPPSSPFAGTRRRIASAPCCMCDRGCMCFDPCCNVPGSGDEDCSADSSADDSTTAPATPNSNSAKDPEVQLLERLLKPSSFDDSHSRCASQQFCCMEPLSLDEAAKPLGTLCDLTPTTSTTPVAPHELGEKPQTTITRNAALRRMATWSVLTPNTLSDNGFIVRGSFIDVEPRLPTPVQRDASHRCHSVPKNMGSDHFLCAESPQLRCKAEATEGSAGPNYSASTSSMSIFPPTPWQY